MTALAELCGAGADRASSLYRQHSDLIEKVGDTIDRLGSVELRSDSPRNYVLPILYGTASAFVSTSDFVNKTVHSVHDDYAKRPGHILNHIFGHQGDWIDKSPGPLGDRAYRNRSGSTNLSVGIHRLMYGHDPFSIGHGDNPFALLTRQYGLVRGVARVFQHLLADTFSRQGLPIPFHSHLDVRESEKTTNILLQLAGKTKGGEGVPFEAFNRMFTLKAVDAGATGLTAALCWTHNEVWNPDDPIAANQVRVIAYSSQFFGKAVIGLAQGGVPYVSWPTLLMAAKEIYQMYRLSWAEIARLEEVTAKIMADNAELKRRIYLQGADLMSHETGAQLRAEFAASDARKDAIVDFFEAC